MTCSGYELRIFAKEADSIDRVIALSKQYLAGALDAQEDASHLKNYFDEHGWTRVPDIIGMTRNADEPSTPTGRVVYAAKLHMADSWGIVDVIQKCALRAIGAVPEVQALEWSFDPDAINGKPGSELVSTAHECLLFNPLPGTDEQVHELDMYLIGEPSH